MNKFEYLPIKTIQKYEKYADLYNVSRVNRGLKQSTRTEKGFLVVYKDLKNHKKLATCLATKNVTWDKYRENQLKAKYAQMKKHNIPLYTDDKTPTKMHTILIMWAYSPDRSLYTS